MMTARKRDLHAMIASAMRNEPGRATRFAATDQPSLQSESSSGTSESTSELSLGFGSSPGMRWCTAHWSRSWKTPADMSTARSANAAATAIVLRRYTNAQRLRDDLEMDGRRADLLPVELDRQALRCVDGDAARAQVLDLGVRKVRPLVELRRGRHEVGLRDIADQHDVEQPVIR